MKYLLRFFFLAFALTAFAACDNSDDGDDDDDENKIAIYRDENRWTENNLKEYYLWPGDVETKAKDAKYTLGWEEFFYSLLSEDRLDGKHTDSYDYFYSYIERELWEETRAQVYANSYGFDFILTASYLFDPVISPQNAYLKIYATVTYVYPDSPAYLQGLKRGDFIGAINGKEIPYKDYSSVIAPLLASSTTTSSVTVTVYEFKDNAYYDQEEGLYIVERKSRAGKQLTISTASIEQNPIFYSGIITSGSNKVGYLVYNQFEMGGGEGTYNDQLKTRFQEFKAGGVSELILDLRYNRGGYVNTCVLLASMIAPSSKAGTVFQVGETNPGREDRVHTFIAENGMTGNGYGTVSGAGTNLGLNKVYILAGHSSASASEALIHCLRGAGITVYHIGDLTEGKNVGMEGIESTTALSNEFKYTLWPVSFYVKDANGQTYSDEGLDPLYPASPGYVVSETTEVVWYDFGNTDDPMLSAALQHITTGSFPLPRHSTRSGTSIQLNKDVRDTAPIVDKIRSYRTKPSRMYVK